MSAPGGQELAGAGPAPTVHEGDGSDEAAAYREELRRARRAGALALGLMTLWAVIALLVDAKLLAGLAPLVALGALPALRMLLRPRPLRPDPSPEALRRVGDGTALVAVEGLPPAEARLALLDELDALKGRPDATRLERLVRRGGSVMAALGTLGWTTAGVVAAFMGASLGDLAPCLLGAGLFGTGWFFIERQRKKETAAARILRERLEALDLGSGEA